MIDLAIQILHKSKSRKNNFEKYDIIIWRPNCYFQNIWLKNVDYFDEYEEFGSGEFENGNSETCLELENDGNFKSSDCNKRNYVLCERSIIQPMNYLTKPPEEQFCEYIDKQIEEIFLLKEQVSESNSAIIKDAQNSNNPGKSVLDEWNTGEQNNKISLVSKILKSLRYEKSSWFKEFYNIFISKSFKITNWSIINDMHSTCNNN